MDQIIDFSNCKRAHTTFGGSDRKFGVVYEGSTYMLKFSENHAKRHDISTSYVNNVISEYLSSHIAQSVGLPAHDTVLGIYNNELVVGCRDFRENANVIMVEFSEYVHARYDSKEIKRIIQLDQIYSSLKDPANDIPSDLQKASIERYWDTFVIDAFVGNFDRHIGNWGYLSENNELRLAPVYDFGSTLFPNMSDKGASDFLANEYEMVKRIMVFPSPALVITDEKVGKVGYYDMLASNYDENCTKAVLRIVPKVNMDKVNRIIDETPFITDTRKQFYKEMLLLRKELLLNRSYVRCFYKEFDSEALVRLTEGHQFSEDDLQHFLQARKENSSRFKENEQQLSRCESCGRSGRSVSAFLSGLADPSHVLLEQRKMMEQYGFCSEYVLRQVNNAIRKREQTMER